MRRRQNFLIFLLITMLIAACTVPPTAQTLTPAANRTPAPAKPTSSNATSEPTTPAAAATPTAVSAQPVSLTLRHPWVNEPRQQFEALIEAFNASAEAVEAKVRVAAVGGDGFEPLAGALEAGEVAEDMVIGWTADLLAAADEWSELSIPAPDAADPNWLSAQLFSNTESFSVVPLLAQPGVIYYNQTWAEEVGYEEAPRTHAELEAQLLAAARQLTDDNIWENNGAGGLFLANSPLSVYSWYASFGGSGLDLTQPAWQESFEYLKDMYGSDASWTGKMNFDYTYFATRYALAYEGTPGSVMVQAYANEQAASADEWTTLPYPSPDGNGALTFETVGIGLKAADANTVRAAETFIKWLLMPEAQEALAELSLFWPVIGKPGEVAPELAEGYPAWSAAAEGEPALHIAPERENWRVARLVVRDANLRLYQLDKQFIPTILELLDKTLEEEAAK